jgi:trehalose 6-phosphate synthase
LRYFERIIQGERIFALGFCDRAGKLAYSTAAFPAARALRARRVDGGEEPRAAAHRRPAARVVQSDLERRARRSASWSIVHDMSFAQRRSADTEVRVLPFRRDRGRWSRSSPW